MGESFIDMLNNPKEMSRIVNEYICSSKWGNPNIKHFGDFKIATEKAFNTKLGQNAKIHEEVLIKIFESPEFKSKIKDNVSKEDYERMYGDGHKVERMSISQNKQIIISRPKINKTSRKGKVYSSGKPQKFTPVQTKFIQIRKQKGISPKQIAKEYNTNFKETPRSQSSITTKVSRTKVYKN